MWYSRPSLSRNRIMLSRPGSGTRLLMNRWASSRLLYASCERPKLPRSSKTKTAYTLTAKTSSQAATQQRVTTVCFTPSRSLWSFTVALMTAPASAVQGREANQTNTFPLSSTNLYSHVVPQ